MKRPIKQIKITKNYNNLFIEETKIISNIPNLPKCEFKHIGSTSIINSIGEEIVDILVIVENLHSITNFDEKRLNNIGYHRVSHNYKGIISYCKIYDFLNINYNFKLFIVQKNSDIYNQFIKFNNLIRNNKIYFTKYQNFKKENIYIKSSSKLYDKNKEIFIKKILNEADVND